MFTKKFFYLALVVFCLSLLKIPSFAQSELKLSVDPEPINLVATPGSSVSAKLKISNGGTKAETLQVNLLKFTAYGERGIPRIKDREAGDDYFDWVTFSEDTFEILPNEWKVITVNINVPTTAAFGYYYAVNFSRKDDIGQDGKSVTRFNGSIANLIMLNVISPKAVSKIDLLGFLSEKRVYEFLPTNFLVKIKNDGNVHVAPRGNIFISSKKNKNIGVIEINENRSNILPDSNRSFEASWTDGTPFFAVRMNGDQAVLDKNGNIKRYLNWDSIKLNKIRFGKYTATMVLVYDDGQRDVPIQATTSFWVIPWRVIFVGLAILALMFSGFKSTLSNLKSKFIKR